MNRKASECHSAGFYIRVFKFIPQVIDVVYINNLTDNLKCNVKLFADDDALFTTVYDPHQIASDLNHSLDIVNYCVRKWRKAFNPDPAKQAIEVAFSTKKSLVDHAWCQDI